MRVQHATDKTSSKRFFHIIEHPFTQPTSRDRRQSAMQIYNILVKNKHFFVYFYPNKNISPPKHLQFIMSIPCYILKITSRYNALEIHFIKTSYPILSKFFTFQL